MGQHLNPDGRDGFSSANGCPAAADLSSFLSGGLPDAELVAISEHVAVCAACERSLEGMSASGPGQFPLQSSLAEFVSEPECARMLAAARTGDFGTAPTRMLHTRTSDEAGSDRAHAFSTGGRQEATFGDFAPETPGTTTLLAPLPSRIGRYEVRSLLGEGSFGRVLLANDPKLHRDVALKVPRFTFDPTESECESFLAEACSAAQLHHPGIVTIFDAGQEVDGTIFIAMEYVKGRSLRARISQGPLEPIEAARILEQVAEALHFAHKKGFVHRDLKPANILIDEGGQVKIADFGLALHDDEQRGRAGEFAGSPGYMAPEQVRRHAHRLDGRTDVWSLGVVLYEVLTGKRPFNGRRSEVLDEILNREPKPPRQIDDTIPLELEEICLKCLKKQTAERYSTAHDVAVALGTWRGSRIPSPRMPRRHRLVLAALSSVVVVALAAGIAFQRHPAGEIREQPNSTTDRSGDRHRLDVLPARDPFAWQPLLTVAPTEVFPASSPNNRWSFSEQRQEVLVDSRSFHLLELGKTANDWYTLQVDISKASWGGVAGLFVGLEPADAENGRRVWNAQTICIDCRSDGVLALERAAVRFRDAPPGTVDAASVTIRAVRVEPVPVRDTMLRVVVTAGRITDVRWGGQRVEELCDPAQSVMESVPNCRGRFGVFDQFGSAVFSNARFRCDGNEEPLH